MNFDGLNPDATMNLSSDETSFEGENMTLDLSNVSEDLPKFEPMPPGVYPAIVENVEFGPAKSSGAPMLTWTFRIVDPQYENRKLFFYNVLNKDFGINMLKRALVRICPDVDMSNFSPKAFAENGEALGLPCRVKVRVRPYQGEKRNEVQDILPAESAEGFFDD